MTKRLDDLMHRSLTAGRQIWLWKDSGEKVHATFCIRHHDGDILLARIIGDEVLEECENDVLRRRSGEVAPDRRVP